MKTPVFKHSNTLYNLSWLLALPVLIDICTACTLFSFWLAWFLFGAVMLLSFVRIVHGLRQKCYRFSLSVAGALLGVAAVLLFFQLSFEHVIDTPVSNPVSGTDLVIKDPILQSDSTAQTDK